MRHTVLVVALATAIPGCKEQRKDPTIAPVSKRDASAPASAEGSLATRYTACWASYNAGRWDELRAWYAPNASIDPGIDGKQLFDVDAKIDADKKARAADPKTHTDVKLVIVADATVIGVVHVTGATSWYAADVVEYDEQGRIKSEEIFRDALGESRPLPAGLVGNHTVVTGIGTDAEQRNAAVIEQFIASVGHRASAKPFEATLAADLVWSERWLAHDFSRSDVTDFIAQLRNGLDGFDYGNGTTWFAGDFVVKRAREEGRPADMPWLGITGDPHTHVSIPALTIFRLDQGHIKAAAEFWTIGALYEQLGIKPPAVTPTLPPAK